MKSMIFALALTMSGLMAQAAVQELAPVTTVEVGGQALLADRNEMTAYVFDVDAGSTSKCYDACAKAWPPILVKAEEKVQAPFGTTPRKDGTLQLTFNARPIYLYEDDQAKGDINGDGIGGVWHIIPIK